MLMPIMGPTVVVALALVLATSVVHAQSPAPSGTKAAPSKSSPAVAKPAWKDLTPAQRDALAPLADEWDSFERNRKLKWLDVANKYPQLSPEGQKRLHERMVEFVKLTPEQRRTARSNFQRAYELPMEQRQTLVQQYQELPPEKKQALADKATKKEEPPRRRSTKPETKAAAKDTAAPTNTKPAADARPAPAKP
jgi:hypothetical protein